ncbi:MAG: extracellular solute-binding protein [Oscillospiraceae bacterium]|jgi:multiple sugar transport system substrate-binding protein|nr:extracellular solute-binding protein [Oscillospiraceae bacterium]
MKKLFSLLLAMLMALSAFAGLGQALAEGGEGKVNLVYYSWEDENDYIKPVVEAFNGKQDRIHVEYRSFPSVNSEYWEKILVMLAAREPIDIVGVNGVTDYANFYSKGVLAPLSVPIKESSYDLSGYGPLVAQFGIPKENGEVEYYGLPHRRGVYAVFVNKTIYEEAGVEIPYGGWTWDEFIEIGHKLKKELPDGRTRWGTAPRGLAWNSPAFGAFLQGQSMLDDDFSNFRDGLLVLNELLNGEKASSPDYVELYQNPSQVTAGNFQATLLASHILGDWGVTNMKRYEREGTMDPSVVWDVVPLPYFPGMQNGTTYGSAITTGITSYSEKKAEAFEFLAFLCGEEGAKIIAEHGTMPGYQSEAVRETYLNIDRTKNLKAFTDAIVLPEGMPHPASSDLTDMVRREAELYLIGEKDIDTVCADVETQRKEIITNAGTF